MKDWAIVVGVIYAFCLMWDALVGLMYPTTRRVKRKDGKFVIQERWIFSPIWWDLGYGDILGMDFTSYKYDSEAEAEAAKDLI